MPKPVTIKDIAKALDVSVSTVSRALNDHPSIGPATRQLVKRTAGKMKYQQNQNAVSFQKGKTFTIGIIVPDLSDEFYSSAVSVIVDTAYKSNYKVFTAQSHNDGQREQELAAKMRDCRVDGLIVSAAKTTSSFEHFKMLDDYNIPVVFFNQVPPMPDIHYVSCNIETGAFEAVNFLLKKGHRVIGMINGPDTLASNTARRQGYIKALLKSRLKYDPSLVINCDLTEEGAVGALNTLIHHKRKPTAVVTYDDHAFLYAAKYLRKRMPYADDWPEFISFSNLSMMNFIDSPPAASIKQFPDMQAQKAIEILLDLLSDGKNRKQQAFYQISIEPKLIEKRPADFHSMRLAAVSF